MSEGTIKKLEQAIGDYLRWIEWLNDDQPKAGTYYRLVLSEFLSYARRRKLAWKRLFTLDTLKAFPQETTLHNPAPALIGLAAYLCRHGKVCRPLPVPNYQVDLPEIYEAYLRYYEQSRQVPCGQVKAVRRVLVSLHDYLKEHHLTLPALRIEHLDTFMAQLGKPLAEGTGRLYRSRLRGFLKYLHGERKILKTDLAPLLVGPPLFARVKPPKFLRPREVQRLFQNLSCSTPLELRTYAMVHLAYALGLRPKEISSISLDDISFSRGELTLRARKNNQPLILPLPAPSIEAVAAYLKRGRAKSASRHLFVSFYLPHGPISSQSVSHYISKAIRRTGLSASAYWIRHTYAQNLLQLGRSIYEIKEMLGHENIQSTQRYLHIHTALMRKVLFDEEL
jgi:site-specific recombinase XerD